MKTHEVIQNPNFIGREFELSRLDDIQNNDSSSILIVYGRRRIGKTELLEQYFRNCNILKFEGIEGKSEQEQRDWVLFLLSQYTDEKYIKNIKANSWAEVFLLIADFVDKYHWTLYFEECQWLANYKKNFVSDLKYVWDNKLRFNNKLKLILCGSAPSFIVNSIIKSKALYNRSQFEFPIFEFSLIEVKQFLKNKDNREVLLAYLTVGGIPEYLKRFSKGQSIYTTLCRESFTQGGFFVHEYQRIFTSSLGENKLYQEIINYLSKRQHATRGEIADSLSVKSGGTLSSLLMDLELCGFINKYTPFNLQKNSLLSRYTITDSYLQFYFKFISPLERRIDAGEYNKKPNEVLVFDNFNKWLGFAFERFCRKYHRIIASILGFSGVEYKSGAYFSRAATKDKSGFQIDLVFERKDYVLTVCEIKYYTGKVSTNVIQQMEKKLVYLPRKDNQTLQRVLICVEGADKALSNRNYFDKIITLDDIFNEKHWD